MRGRKPVPTQLKIIRGNPSRRPLKPEPKLAIAKQSTPPAWLSPRAREAWTQLEPDLCASGLLTVGDLSAFAGYCSALAVAWEAEEGLAAAKGGLKQKSFWIGSARKAWTEVRKWAIEFGLTPSARGRVSVATPPSEKGNSFLQLTTLGAAPARRRRHS